jgi:hypothetical protein
MKIAYIDPEGIARERERAAYRVALVSEGDRLHLGFLPEGEGLTCLEYARIFSMALCPGIDAQEARVFAQWLSDNLEGLDAIYSPEPDPRPTYPNVVPLRAA